MKITVYRKGSEIFAANGDGNVLEFPAGTLIDSVASQSSGVRVYLAEPPAVPVPTDRTEQFGPNILRVIYAEQVLIREGKLIYAIKSYRGRTGLGLRESKLAIDAEAERIRRGEQEVY